MCQRSVSGSNALASAPQPTALVIIRYTVFEIPASEEALNLVHPSGSEALVDGEPFHTMEACEKFGFCKTTT